MLIPLWARVLAILAALGGVYLWIDRTAYNRGVAACEAAQAIRTAATQALLDDAADKARDWAAKWAVEREANRMLAMEIEDETRADVDVCRVPSADSLRRLKKRWGAAN